MKLTSISRWTLLLAAVALSVGPVHASSAKDYRQSAQRYLDGGDIKKAIIDAKNAVQADPGDGESRYFLGEIYLSLSQAGLAEKEFDRANEAGIARARVLVPLAKAYLMQGNYRDVIEGMHPLEGRDPKTQAALHVLQARAYLMADRRDDAAEALQKAGALVPESPEHALGLALLALSDGHVEAYQRHVGRALELDPRNAEALTASADLLSQEGRLEDALLAYQDALASDPYKREALLGSAMVQAEMRRLDEAERLLEQLDRLSPGTLHRQYLAAVIAFYREDYDAAQALLAPILNRAPDYPMAKLLAGVSSYLKGELEAANAHLEDFTKANPGHLPARKLLAMLKVKQGEPEKAVEVLEAVRDQGVAEAQFLALLGGAYLEAGDASNAVQYLEKAAELDPDAASIQSQIGLGHLALGKADAAVSHMENAVKLEPDLLEADLLLVQIHLRNREYDRALSVAQALQAKRPTNPVPYNAMAMAHFGAGEADKARQALRKALEVDPGFRLTHISLADLDMRQGNLAAARGHYQAVLQLDTDHTEAYIGLAKLESVQGNRGKVVEWLTKAQDENPGGLQPGLMLALHYVSINESRKALPVARAVVDAHPDSPVALETLASIQLQNKESDNAIRSYERLRVLRPEHVVAWNNLAWLYHERSDRRALEYARQARELAPQQPDVLDTYGWIELLEGDVTEGLKVLQEAVVLGPNNPTIHYHLAVAQEMNGRPDTARKTLAGLLKTGTPFPERSEAQERLKRLEARK